jgi:large subunit ribosomal protein L25
MSNETITLVASKRDVLGKQVRALRLAGQTPAVVHDHGKDSLHITVEEKDLKKVFSNAGKHHPVVLAIDGKNYTSLIKEVTYRPATSQIYHTVFQAVSANETVKAEIPVHLVGEIPAEKISLLILQSIDHVEVEAIPGNLVDSIEVDATSLAESGDKLHVSDIKAPKGVTILTDPELVLVAVETPRDQIAEADAAAAELAADAGTDATAAEGEEAASEEGDAAASAESTDEKQS